MLTFGTECLIFGEGIRNNYLPCQGGKYYLPGRCNYNSPGLPKQSKT